MEGVKLLQGAFLACRLQAASKSPVLTSPILPPSPEIYAAEPLRRRECLYYLALGYYKLGNWEHAKKFNSMSEPSSSLLALCLLSSSSRSVTRRADLLLSKEPTNMQAQSLNSLIDDGMAKGQPTFLFSC